VAHRRASRAVASPVGGPWRGLEVARLADRLWSRSGEPGEYSSSMATYRMEYGDGDDVVTETYENVDEVEREDGWLVLFRGSEAILRVQEAHVKSFDLQS
jgi:hypothetical protein